jgi:hypothetical protein
MDVKLKKCSHTYTSMFYLCEHKEHIHCIRCGEIYCEPKNIGLFVKTFEYRYGCEKLTNHFKEET